jgi:hypothetical protein
VILILIKNKIFVILFILIYRDFRDELIKRFALYSHDFPIRKHQRKFIFFSLKIFDFLSGCKWTIEILYSQIIEDVIHFNQNFKSMPVYYDKSFIFKMKFL